jgi:dTMP kinase
LSKLIVFEGIDGVGKSTQLRMAAEALTAAGHRVVTTAEPWEMEIAPDDPPGVVACKIAVNRYEHTNKVIRPALDAGKIVLCDRYTLSTMAYQGYAGGVELSIVRRLNRIATSDLPVSLHVWLYADPLVAKQRLEQRGETVSDDQLDYLRRVHQGYWEIFVSGHTAEPMAMADGNGTVEEVHATIMTTVLHLLTSDTKVV